LTIEKFTAETIADLELVIENPDGDKTVSIRLGKPYEKAPSQWRCQVALAGLNPPTFEFQGEDAFHALNLALCFTGAHLKNAVKPNGKICYGKTSAGFGHSYPIEYSFPSFPTAQEPGCPECPEDTPKVP
jgi:hypothetical protein